ncbi:hypothetical protein [Rhizobium sullae]|uniref:Uncharacterized protein n=1 Tax=Rhizobium sullae TaxID=50338 RepID=A0A4R3QBA8_RHISU|nr:hypothetical protein [Rhizobium sullae]TCU17897.1 hypothetical protein EV132_10313 [Rhizobium sullae]
MSANQLDSEDDYAYAEHIGEAVVEAEKGIQAVREAFMLVLYHFWEHQACINLDIKVYKQDDVFEAADRKGPQFRVEKPGINRLRLIANCVKLGSAPLYTATPELFDEELIRVSLEFPDCRVALRLRDADVDFAFDAVRNSGPRIMRQEAEAGDSADCHLVALGGRNSTALGRAAWPLSSH